MEKKEWIYQILLQKIETESRRYEEKEQLLVTCQEKWAGGYHTRRTGSLHPLRDAAEYADAVFQAGDRKRYEQGEKIIRRILSLQDTAKESRTFGLWSYYLEESLEEMIVPDYNWADFISKSLLGIRILAGDQVSKETRAQMDQAISRAAWCSVKRNVGLDYTNIALMSSMTILSAGEHLGDEQLYREGRRRLKMFYEYTSFNGAFTEYNSSAYLVVALNEIGRMLKFFKDPECREIAERLNEYAWDCLSGHYNTWIGQLTPPQMRAYSDLDRGGLAWNVYLGTNGAFGKIPDIKEISMESLLYPPHCPAKFLERFHEKERFLNQTFYRKNQLRDPDSDLTIVRDPEHPDLIASSYQTENYSMGIFQSSDCWNQRRNAMVLWGKEKTNYLRLRGMSDGYDFCSAMVYGVQEKNKMIGHLGYVWDRGSFHYILDKDKNGIYETGRLYFQFEIGEESDGVFEPLSKQCFQVVAEACIFQIRIYCFVFDGKPGRIELSEDRKKLLLIGYEGEQKKIDLRTLKDTYGVFALKAADKGADEPLTLRINSSGETVHTEGLLNGKHVVLESPKRVLMFLEASKVCSRGSFSEEGLEWNEKKLRK